MIAPYWKRIAAALAVLVMGCAGTVGAGGGPDGVLVVVNGQSWSSRSVANEYVALRGIPPSNVVVISDLGIRESIDVETFRGKILMPILRHMEKSGLGPQIDCIAYSTDFPYRVDVSGDQEWKQAPKVIGSMASITGLTYMYQPVLLKRPAYLSFTGNDYALYPFEQQMDPPWGLADRELYGTVQAFFLEKRLRDQHKGEPTDEDRVWERAGWERSVEILQGLVARHPHSLEARYNLACGLSVLGRHDEAMRELTTTVEDGWFNGAIASAAKSGWTNVTDIAKDEDFSPLREREDFQQLVARGKDHLVHMPLARGFDASVGWDAVGRRCAPYKGSRYFLSTMLGYTSGRGNSYAEVLGYLRRAQAADATQPKGTVYYLLNDNVRSDCREWAVSGAVARLRESGVNASVETGKIPQGKDDVMGLMAGTDTFDWPGSGSTILPGAICEHLTSYGGIMDEKSSQTPLSVFLAAGAAGASGSVAEPHAIQAKFPTAFIQAYYAEGCSLAEAFYQAVTGPYQLLIVGDPLCQPWARPPAVVVEGLTPNETVKGDVKVTVSLAEGSEPAQVCHLYIDGRRFATVRIDEQVDLPTARLSEGYHDLRAVAVAANAVQTQGRAVVPFVVKNLGRDLPSLPLEQTVFRHGERIPLSFDLPDVEKLDVFCHLGRLGGLDSGQGTVHVDTTMLGLGTVALRFGLVYSDSTRFSCPPVEVTILPPEPLALPADSLPAAFEPGIQVLTKLDGTKKETTAASLSGDWLEQGGGADGASFAARGYFDVPIGGVYQFQFQGNVLGSCRVKVDDQTQPIPAGEGWRSMLVSLTKGTHSLTLSGSCVDAPRLHVRFGGPGCRTVSEKTFRRGVAQ